LVIRWSRVRAPPALGDDSDNFLISGQLLEQCGTKSNEPATHARADEEGFYRKWRTWQISDHRPLWVRITTDFADEYLTQLAE
jgi:hypothetical protein